VPKKGILRKDPQKAFEYIYGRQLWEFALNARLKTTIQFPLLLRSRPKIQLPIAKVRKKNGIYLKKLCLYNVPCIYFGWEPPQSQYYRSIWKLTVQEIVFWVLIPHAIGFPTPNEHNNTTISPILVIKTVIFGANIPVILG
jgi:hypothetical protein